MASEKSWRTKDGPFTGKSEIHFSGDWITRVIAVARSFVVDIIFLIFFFFFLFISYYVHTTTKRASLRSCRLTRECVSWVVFPPPWAATPHSTKEPSDSSVDFIVCEVSLLFLSFSKKAIGSLLSFCISSLLWVEYKQASATMLGRGFREPHHRC